MTSRSERSARPVRRSPWRRALRVVLVTALALLLATAVAWAFMVRMPGRSHRGALPPLTADETKLAAELRADVEALAVTIGERSVWKPAGLAAAADHIDAAFRSSGLAVARLPFSPAGHRCENVEATIPGGALRDEIVVVGAHYDSVRGTVGANDNATGVAALLALARRFGGRAQPRTLRFVAFSCEEPPWFQTANMGSMVYAWACRDRGDRITAMVSLETIGFYTDEDGTQSYPMPFGLFYPSRGNFLGFVGNLTHARLVRDAIATFRSGTAFPSEGAALPTWVPGAGWSDHWAFWKAGYPAFMVTDTAPFRYEHYHTREDTADKVDYAKTARVVAGMERVITSLAGAAK